MKIFLEKDNKTIDFEVLKEKTISDVLKELDISIESVIILKNDQVTIEEDIVINSDSLKVLSVVSGG